MEFGGLNRAYLNKQYFSNRPGSAARIAISTYYTVYRQSIPVSFDISSTYFLLQMHIHRDELAYAVPLKWSEIDKIGWLLFRSTKYCLIAGQEKNAWG